MSHHGREYEDDRDICGAVCSTTAARLRSAVELIQQIETMHLKASRNGGPSAGVLCGRWLEANEFACEATRRRQRERRALELDAEIDRLRKERESL